MLKKYALSITIFYSVVLAVLSLIHISGVKEINYSHTDKIFHFIAYSILTWFWFKAFYYKFNYTFNKALAIAAVYSGEKLSVFELPDEKWSRRISGVYGNLLANQQPSSAFAVLTKNEQGGYLVSLRAPLENKQGAGDICSQFETGGGRAAAAGINHLPSESLQHFISTVETYYA